MARLGGLSGHEALGPRVACWNSLPMLMLTLALAYCCINPPRTNSFSRGALKSSPHLRHESIQRSAGCKHCLSTTPLFLKKKKKGKKMLSNGGQISMRLINLEGRLL